MEEESRVAGHPELRVLGREELWERERGGKVVSLPVWVEVHPVSEVVRVEYGVFEQMMTELGWVKR